MWDLLNQWLNEWINLFTVRLAIPVCTMPKWIQTVPLQQALVNLHNNPSCSVWARVALVCRVQVAC